MSDFAVYVDTDIRFFKTDNSAYSFAREALEDCRAEGGDGWHEECADGVCILKVTHRAAKDNPDADYRAINYSLHPVAEPQSSLDLSRIPEALRGLKWEKCHKNVSVRSGEQWMVSVTIHYDTHDAHEIEFAEAKRDNKGLVFTVRNCDEWLCLSNIDYFVRLT